MNAVATPERQLTPDELILNNTGLVGYFANRFSQSTGVDYMELFQEGSIGLIKAARSFSESKGSKFASFARNCIQNKMRDYLRKGRRGIRCESLELIPNWQDKAGQYDADISFLEIDKQALEGMSDRQKQLISLLVSGFSQREAADEMGLSASTITRLIAKARANYKQASGFEF